MLPSFAAGTLVVLGVLIAVLGFIAGSGNVTFTVIGLASVAAGGLLGVLDRRIRA